MEFEAGESIIPPEMNAAYDHDEHALPSVLHRQRAKEHGEWVGFNANSVFNDGLMVKLLVNDGQVQFKALPLDLREQDARVLMACQCQLLQQLRIVLLLVSTKSVRHLILGLFLIQ